MRIKIKLPLFRTHAFKQKPLTTSLCPCRFVNTEGGI